jgi:choline-sulfatase
MKKWRERRGVDQLSPEQNHRAIAAYYGLVAELDRNVGRITETIRSGDQSENTVIIYTSDHGDMCCDHGMWWKSSFYEGSAGIPLIASWPGHFPSGTVDDSVASLIDVGPTLLDIAGAPPLPDVSGRSLLRLLQGQSIPDWPDQVFCEYAGLLGDQPSCMIRSERWNSQHRGQRTEDRGQNAIN